MQTINPEFYELYDTVLEDQEKNPDLHTWPAYTFRQQLLNLRGLLFGPKQPTASQGGYPAEFDELVDRFGGFGALFGTRNRWPFKTYPDSVGWWKKRKLCDRREFQPDNFTELASKSGKHNIND